MKKVSWIIILVCAVLVMIWPHLTTTSAAYAKQGTSAQTLTGRADPIINNAGHPMTTSATSQPQPFQTQDSAHFVEISFRATHATPDGYLIHNWSQVNQQFMSIHDLAKLTDKIQQELHIQNAKIVSYRENGENFYEVYGTWPNQSAVNVTFSSFHYPNQSSSTLLIVRLQSTSSDLTPFSEAYINVEKAVQSLQLTPQISACIEGFSNARMSDGQKAQVISEAFGAVKAHRIEGLQSELVTSISGYSPLSANYMTTNGQKMNLQVAAHYDAYHHRTNVLVGTPIITETY